MHPLIPGRVMLQLQNTALTYRVLHFGDCFTAGVQVELPVFLPGLTGIAAALCAVVPSRESSLPADPEEG